jgi:ribonuclease D
MWEPPSTRDPVELLEQLIDQLGALGSRSWQIGLTAPTLTEAVLDADAWAKGQPKNQPRRSRGKAKESEDQEDGSEEEA